MAAVVNEAVNDNGAVRPGEDPNVDNDGSTCAKVIAAVSAVLLMIGIVFGAVSVAPPLISQILMGIGASFGAFGLTLWIVLSNRSLGDTAWKVAFIGSLMILGGGITLLLTSAGVSAIVGRVMIGIGSWGCLASGINGLCMNAQRLPLPIVADPREARIRQQELELRERNLEVHRRRIARLNQIEDQEQAAQPPRPVPENLVVNRAYLDNQPPAANFPMAGIPLQQREGEEAAAAARPRVTREEMADMLTRLLQARRHETEQ